MADGGLLAGKQLLITGVITLRSIAYAVAREAQLQGARIVLTAYGRPTLVRRLSARLPEPAPVVDLDVTDESDLRSLAGRVSEHLDRVDGLVHAIAFAPASCLGAGFLAAPWSDVATTLRVSAYSLAALTEAVRPLMPAGASVVGLDFDAARVSPGYGWMGVAKAGLGATARALAAEYGPRGIRINLVSAGPLRTAAGSAVPGEQAAEAAWQQRAPLGWDPTDPRPVATACVALLSSQFCATTGSVIHVDGGYHAMA
ncbi:enoyl-ACP reductase FabI [Streptomyces guryensis]|uniref:Enoyl-[acyl-carrier-protein] reductase [NADH] n=1 Tax=Streptomyces guryensis TaxID=2886947 RepID=A0A9Q3VXX7_9ACTN|nr:enoyl-ACP reductase FabI [Streptomyces guryensis]MCD9880192.1 enoyl-ACP reductase FabI [Streptomyces guryensis]